MGTLNPDTIWTKLYAGVATNFNTKITDPNLVRNDPEKAIFSSFPDFSEEQDYPIFIIEPPMGNESGYAINSPTRVFKGNVDIIVHALSSADLKSAMNVIKAGFRGAKDYLEGQGVKLVFGPDGSLFEDDRADTWQEGKKKIHFQVTSMNIKSTGTS